VTERHLALVVGGAVWAGVATLYTGGLLAKGRADVGRALIYNLPIAFLFLVLAAYLVIRALRLGPTPFLKSHTAIVVVWALGLGILYLRLISTSLEVSGHLAWLPLLTAQAWILGLPMWVVAMGVGATLSAAYLKFAVFQGPSGGPGLVVGLVLATALMFTARAKRAAGEQ
jgi:hypothetical protein